MLPFVLSYGVLVTQESVLYGSITLLLIVPVFWIWVRIFRLDLSSSCNDRRKTKLDRMESDTAKVNNDTQKESLIPNIDPSRDQVLRELRKHEEHYQNATCLDCRYEGIAGVVGRNVPWYVTWWVIIPLCFTGIGIIGGLILGLFRASQIKPICECPQCASNSLVG
jgi:hypothetical protein